MGRLTNLSYRGETRENEAGAITPRPKPKQLYLSKYSKGYQFAVLVWQGKTYDVAAQALGVTRSAAEKYRADLRAAAARLTGQSTAETTYLFALRLLFEPDEVNYTGGVDERENIVR